MRTSLLAALGAAMVAACSVPTEDVGSGEQQVLSDAVSITRRPDGRFDVFCRGRDGAPDYAQTVEASAIHDNTVCSPATPPRPSSVVVSSRTLALPRNENNVSLDTWGADTWKGFASFDAVLSGNSGQSFSAKIVDGSGASYALSTQKTRYERLPTPIKIIGSSDYYANASVTLSGGLVDVSETVPIPASALTTKYNGTSATVLKVVGTELSGAPITLTAEAHFYNNFTNVNACSRITLVDAANQTVVLDPSSFGHRATFKAPVKIQAQSICISSRLATPENANADVDVDVTRIEIGASPP